MAQHRAVFFGAIGTLVDTSDMQRRAFNAAFAQAGLDWNWSHEIYRPMLSVVGGRNRIAHYAETRGQGVDAAALHSAKTRIYQQMLHDGGVTLRPGVAQLLARAQAAGKPVAWTTTTARSNVDAIIAASGGALRVEMFSLITDASMVQARKPDPEVYHLALATLGLVARDVLVIEDTPESAAAALAADLDVIAFEGTVPPDTVWLKVLDHLDDLTPLAADMG